MSNSELAPAIQLRPKRPMRRCHGFAPCHVATDTKPIPLPDAGSSLSGWHRLVPTRTMARVCLRHISLAGSDSAHRALIGYSSIANLCSNVAPFLLTWCIDLKALAAVGIRVTSGETFRWGDTHQSLLVALGLHACADKEKCSSLGREFHANVSCI